MPGRSDSQSLNEIAVIWKDTKQCTILEKKITELHKAQPAAMDDGIHGSRLFIFVLFYIGLGNFWIVIL